MSKLLTNCPNLFFFSPRTHIQYLQKVRQSTPLLPSFTHLHLYGRRKCRSNCVLPAVENCSTLVQVGHVLIAFRRTTYEEYTGHTSYAGTTVQHSTAPAAHTRRWACHVHQSRIEGAVASRESHQYHRRVMNEAMVMNLTMGKQHSATVEATL